MAVKLFCLKMGVGIFHATSQHMTAAIFVTDTCVVFQTRLSVCPREEESEVGQRVDQILLSVPSQDQDSDHDPIQSVDRHVSIFCHSIFLRLLYNDNMFHSKMG